MTSDPLDGLLLHIEPRRTGTLITRYWPATPPRSVCAGRRVHALMLARAAIHAGDDRDARGWVAVAQEWRFT